MTRRTLIKGALIAAARAGVKSRALDAVRPLDLFPYGDVQFPEGPLQRQLLENRTLLLELSEDSLLRPFRLREGVPAPGVELGGWYETYGFAPAETFGQWMSALARFHAITGDDATRAKVASLVQGYAATVEPSGKFYNDNRFPAYVYDKLVCGLMDAHRLAGDPAALHTLSIATDAAVPHLPPHAMPHRDTPVLHHEDFTEHCWDESYTLPENLFLAGQITGDRRYQDLARRFLYHEFFDALARGENALPGKHAYSHVNSLSSAAQAYLQLGDQTYFDAARNGFAMVEQQSYATGGWGPDEHFFVPGSGKLSESLRATHASFETPCGSYAHFKITRYLLRITRDAAYGDSMERVLYNTVLGAKPIQSDGRAFYYSDYNWNGQKVYHSDKWPCCSGTLPQIAADYHVSTYLREPGAIYLNLFVPSTVTWHEGNSRISVRQLTDYPYDGQVQLQVEASTPLPLSIYIRIPKWADGARISVNGGRAASQTEPGTFSQLRRDWKSGDHIELELPMRNRLERIDAQHPDTVALARGPLVLFRLLDDSGVALRREELLGVKPAFSKARVWQTQDGRTRFKAFPDIADERYSAYSMVGSVS